MNHGPAHGHDLTKATMPAAGGGYDLRRAAQTPRDGTSGFDHRGTVRQSPGGGGGLPVGKVTRAAKAPGTAIPTKAKKKG